jgi:hypothetical protein
MQEAKLDNTTFFIEEDSHRFLVPHKMEFRQIYFDKKLEFA